MVSRVLSEKAVQRYKEKTNHKHIVMIFLQKTSNNLR